MTHAPLKKLAPIGCFDASESLYIFEARQNVTETSPEHARTSPFRALAVSTDIANRKAGSWEPKLAKQFLVCVPRLKVFEDPSTCALDPHRIGPPHALLYICNTRPGTTKSKKFANVLTTGTRFEISQNRTGPWEHPSPLQMPMLPPSNRARSPWGSHAKTPYRRNT